MQPVPMQPDPSTPIASRGSAWEPLYWLLGGAAYGIALRVLIGALPSRYGEVMSLAFLVATPIAVGALAVYGARRRSPSVLYMIFMPWLALLLMMIGSAVGLLEGAICIAMMAPLLFVCGSIGGLAMGLALRWWQRRNGVLRAVALLPLLVLLGESQVPLVDREQEIRRAIDIDAPAAVVWEEIRTARDIRADELPPSLTHLIGVPRPVEGVNLMTPDGEVRYSRWERGVNFRAQITGRVEHASMSWHYVFDADSFPAGSMDEHVAIGGRYFDLRDTTFHLQPLDGGRTRLELVAHYRVTTPINAYAVPAAALLGRDFVDTILGLYKRRSERRRSYDSASVSSTRSP